MGKINTGHLGLSGEERRFATGEVAGHSGGGHGNGGRHVRNGHERHVGEERPAAAKRGPRKEQVVNHEGAEEREVRVQDHRGVLAQFRRFS